MAGSNVETRFTAKDQLSPTIKGLDKQLGGLQASAMGLASSLGGGYMVARIAQAAWEIGKLGAQSLDTKGSFASMMSSVGLSTNMLAKMRQAAGGTVDDLSLMQSMNLALAGTTGKFSAAMAEAQPRLLEIARAAYKMNPALGSVQYLYQSLNTGLKRNTPLLIDNTGVVVKLAKAHEDYAKSLGKTVQSLTQEEQQMALLEGVKTAGGVLIEQVGGVEAMGDAYAKLDTAMVNLRASLGEMLAEPVAEFAMALAEVARNLNALAKGDKEHIADQRAAEEATHKRMVALAAIARANERIRHLEEMGAGAMSAATRAQQQAMIAEQKAIIAKNMDVIADTKLSEANRELAKSASEADEAIAHWSGGSLAELYGVAEKAAGAINDINKQMGVLKTGIGLAGWGQQTPGIVKDSVAAESQLREDSARDTATKYLDIWESAYRDQRSMIESVMQPTQSFDATSMLDQMGLHMDTWDEAVRRMADVANRGGESPWVNLLNIPPDVLAAGGDRLKGYAANYVREFYLGLHPEAVDREAVKDRVREMITGGANMERLVSEIAAEMGGVDKALVQKAMGVFDPIQAGIDTARDTLEESEGTIGGLGNSFMGYLTKGATQGTAMAGFVDAIVVAIIKAMTDEES